MYRRAYTLLVGVAAVMGVLALLVSIRYDQPLLDPEGKFLGPSWARLPILLALAIGIDLLPKAIWTSRGRPGSLMPAIRQRLRTHWTRERITLVVLGVVCFYVTYVSYRNLKSALPFVMDAMYDRELHQLDRVLFFGHDPSTVLHTALGTNLAAYFLSYIYLWFLPLVPLALMAWLVWSRNLSHGYWFATSQCLAWSLGTLSYYALPTLGPGLEYPPLYADLAKTPTNDLMDALVRARQQIRLGGYDGQGVEGIVNSVAGFASLHCAITLLVALMIQYTLKSRVLKIVFWANFGFTAVATVYFGWHYLADDIAGVMIAFISFYVGGIASGQKFEKRSLRSHSTTTTSQVPVDAD